MTRQEQFDAIVAEVAALHNVSVYAVLGWTKRREVVRARDDVIWRLSNGCGWGQSEIARLFDMNPSSVWAALNRETKRTRSVAWSRKTRAAAVGAMA